jgi:putative transposase
MKRKRFTEAQIIGILKEAEAGAKSADLCRRHAISEQTFYRWKAKYAGLEVNEAKRLRTLEHENGRLKRLVADLTLDNQALKELVGKRSNARGAADRGAGAQGQVQAQRAAGVRARRAGSIELSLSPSARRLAGIARASADAGGRATSLRLSTAPRPAPARGLHRESQARLSSLHPGGPHRSSSPPAAAHAPRCAPAGPTHPHE